MDNVPFQKHRSTKETFKESDHILVYLPPYSPFLKLIENMFAKWKLLLREAKPYSEGQLLELIESCSRKIPTENWLEYFSNVFAFLPKCMKRETIID